jgi:hypothetical protein
VVAALPAYAADRALPDTGRVVGGVRVTDDGIEIFENDGSLTVQPSRRRVSGGDSPGGVHITIDSDKDVDGHGPIIVVDSDEAGIVRVFSDAHVPAGRHVEGDVVAVFGSARIDGEVSGTVVSVLGSVELGPGATVSGDAVAVGGALELARGATVHGESVSVGFLPFSWGVPTLAFLLTSIACSFLLTLFVGWLLIVTMPRRMRRTAITVTRRTGSSLVIGMVSPPLVIITIGLLFITVIGIPGAFLLPILYGLILWAGQIAASYVVGCRLMGRATGQGGMMLPLFVGTLFVALFFVAGAILAVYPAWRSAALFFSLAGLLLIVVLAIVGSGAILVSRIGSRPDDGFPAPSPVGGVPPTGPTPAAAPVSSAG